MDLNRLYRAKVADKMQQIEQRRRQFLAGKIKPNDLDAAEWRLIALMDEWGQDAGGDQ